VGEQKIAANPQKHNLPLHFVQNITTKGFAECDASESHMEFSGPRILCNTLADYLAGKTLVGEIDDACGFPALCSHSWEGHNLPTTFEAQ
jgi:hypothetical protein